MKRTQAFGLAFLVSILIAGWLAPTAAADLPKGEKATATNKVVTRHPMRIAGAGWLSGPTRGFRFPIVLGVAY